VPELRVCATKSAAIKRTSPTTQMTDIAKAICRPFVCFMISSSLSRFLVVRHTELTGILCKSGRRYNSVQNER